MEPDYPRVRVTDDRWIVEDPADVARVLAALDGNHAFTLNVDGMFVHVRLASWPTGPMRLQVGADSETARHVTVDWG